MDPNFFLATRKKSFVTEGLQPQANNISFFLCHKFYTHHPQLSLLHASFFITLMEDIFLPLQWQKWTHYSQKVPVTCPFPESLFLLWKLWYIQYTQLFHLWRFFQGCLEKLKRKFDWKKLVFCWCWLSLTVTPEKNNTNWSRWLQ